MQRARFQHVEILPRVRTLQMHELCCLMSVELTNLPIIQWNAPLAILVSHNLGNVPCLVLIVFPHGNEVSLAGGLLSHQNERLNCACKTVIAKLYDDGVVGCHCWAFQN